MNSLATAVMLKLYTARASVEVAASATILGSSESGRMMSAEGMRMDSHLEDSTAGRVSLTL